METQHMVHFLKEQSLSLKSICSIVCQSENKWNFLQLINLIKKYVTAFLQMLHMVWLYFCF